MPETARILNIQRLSTEDGPGIRTTIFFKGCPLSCIWCHNPESISKYYQIQWFETRCIGCKSCIAVCNDKALSEDTSGKIIINRTRCNVCGRCTEICPTTALEILGYEITIENILSEILKDKAYYEYSGGGVTASGGEPTMQAEATSTLFKIVQKMNIHTALDTCGFCSQKSLEMILPHTDLILFDIKFMDFVLHQKYTGQNNFIIINNLLWIRDQIQKKTLESKLWIRTPLIPNLTSKKENILSISQFIKTELSGIVDRWELCSFNNLCKSKYERLGRKWDLAGTPLMENDEITRIEDYAKKYCENPDKVFITGIAQ